MLIIFSISKTHIVLSPRQFKLVIRVMSFIPKYAIFGDRTILRKASEEELKLKKL